MNLGRIFANAIARRVAFVLVALLFAALGIDGARAAPANNPDCNTAINGRTACTQGEANMVCQSKLAAVPGPAAGWEWKEHPTCTNLVSTKRYYCNGSVWNPKTGNTLSRFCGYQYYDQTCAQRSEITSTYYPKSGSISCNAGCQIRWARNSDSTSQGTPNGSVCTGEDMPQQCDPDTQYWNPLLNACEPTTPECPNGEKPNGRGECGQESCPKGMILAPDNTCTNEKSECPAGNVKSPSGGCLPGEGQCAQGEARRENGTCGKDSDGDGVADDDAEDGEDDPDKKNDKASGGDNCDTPPSCSGSAIACMQVKIQWRIDCNTRKNRNVSGGACNAMPVCTGDKCDAMEYASLIQQWKAACALERLKVGEGGDTGTAEYLAATRAAEKAAADAIAGEGDGHDGVSEDTIFKDLAAEGDGFNPNMFGGQSGGMCSFSTTLQLMGKPIELPGEFWTLASMIGWLVVASAYIWVAVKIGGE
ncbi:hypothetical protein [Xanthomonas sp. XNM01]|uniref:hypothetical protein n=1 Tax=Xanthomonas sp. XNM01 TaxID=2769289 RepID=UPI0017849485|nr:hypothetical protein [Xanthomonas sp. XNM01]MBD9368381.1 hypothetical protein [Xanthomonas sp. XNM01]